MGSQLYWIYAFNIIVNSTLAFLTSLLLIEFFICVFRIKHPRIKVICRILPFFKICLDLCLYQISKWALFHGVNPILAEKGTRKLSLQFNPFAYMQFSLQDGKTFSLADVAALSVDPCWIQGIVIVAGFGSVIAIFLYLKRFFQEKRLISKILNEAVPISVNNLNGSLTAWIEKKQVTIACSNDISSPCVIGKTILFPKQLLQDLSDMEIEAIIAHEMAHLRWMDCTTRIACSLAASLFWWIPTKWWQNRIEEMQEQASDAMIYQFGISGTILAEAILKTAQKMKPGQSQLVFSFVGNKSLFRNRMEEILKTPSSRSMGWKIIQYGLLFSALMSVLFGTLWIF